MGMKRAGLVVLYLVVALLAGYNAVVTARGPWARAGSIVAGLALLALAWDKLTGDQ